jgi:cardiolipin synthase
LEQYIPHITISFVVDVVVVCLVVPYVVLKKKDPTSAVAWCLVVLLVPLIGALLFWIFGFTHISRPLRLKKQRKDLFRYKHQPDNPEAIRAEEEKAAAASFGHLGAVANRVGAFPLSPGNGVTLYNDTQNAFDALLAAVEAAQDHVHLEFFIIRWDSAGEKLVRVLTGKAREGAQVRLLYDDMGCVNLNKRFFWPLQRAGGRVAPFLPLNPLRSHIQINLRNHRKIVVIDGKVGFTGGMNIGDEYLGKSKYFGYWRDEFLRLQGPAVAGLQRIFAEDWDFAMKEPLSGKRYFPRLEPAGDSLVQVIDSGPDEEVKRIREMYFAAILSAEKYIRLATPYFVPDTGLLDALRLARYRGVEVDIITLWKPDHVLPFFAGRYYWDQMLAVGARIWRYQRGMMHSKILIVDGQWAMMGSANFDNRSLLLNFEAACILYTQGVVAELEKHYIRDREDCVRLQRDEFARRSFWMRLAESGARLLSPVL